MIISLVKEGAGLCAFRAFDCLFVCFVPVGFFHFSLPLGVGVDCGL